MRLSLIHISLKLVKVVVNGVAAVGPVINTVTDSTSKAINGQLSSGGALVLGGVNLKIQGDDPSIGVYLTPTTEGAAPMKAPVVIANSPSQVIVQMPTLADGQYTVSPVSYTHLVPAQQSEEVYDSLGEVATLTIAR